LIVFSRADGSTPAAAHIRVADTKNAPGENAKVGSRRFSIRGICVNIPASCGSFVPICGQMVFTRLDAVRFRFI
jgi:hypothetical protein